MQIIKSALISPCGTYRYWLRRVWDPALPLALFGLLNPSKADAEIDDPTARRGIGFAMAWGYGGLIFVNMYAFRSTDPKQLLKVPDPIGPDNDRHIQEQAAQAEIKVAAWGSNYPRRHRGKGIGDPRIYFRVGAMRRLLGPPVYCLGVTQNGDPKHPLYLPKETKPQIFWDEEEAA